MRIEIGGGGKRIKDCYGEVVKVRETYQSWCGVKRMKKERRNMREEKERLKLASLQDMNRLRLVAS